MTEKEFDKLKQGMKVVQQRTISIQRDLEQEIEKAVLRHGTALTLKIDFAILERELKDLDTSLGKVSAFFAAQVVELKDRVEALETALLANVGTLSQIDKILGPPNTKTPRELDKPPGYPRTRRSNPRRK